LIILIIFIVILWKYPPPLSRWLNLTRLFQQKEELLLSVQNNLLLASVIYILAYIAVVALSVSGATLLTLTGGFLFGPCLATLLINLGATSGALIIFLAARYFLGTSLQKKYASQLEKFNKEVVSNGKFYFLTLRFNPCFLSF